MRSHDKSPTCAGDWSQAATPPRLLNRPPADALAQRVAAALPGAGGDALALALAASVRDQACYEASVRGGAGATPTAGRMMIEQASREVLDAIAATLGVELPPTVGRWLDLAEQERVPLIVGWDRRGGGDRRCVKVYVNASDASGATRTRLCAALAPGVRGDESPAVLGMNARADGIVETKLYVQAADAVALAKGLGARAGELAGAARAEGADAGGVLSFDAVGAVLRARAFFIALREPRDGETWPCVRALSGYDPRRVESLLPFAPAPPRSLGISLGDATWTLYFKPRDSGRAPEALEPTAVFRSGDIEVGVFVEPTEHAARAFRRTERHAVSVRVRDGKPSPGALESLVDWFTARLRASERGAAALGTCWADPPAPWRHIDGSSAGPQA